MEKTAVRLFLFLFPLFSSVQPASAQEPLQSLALVACDDCPVNNIIIQSDSALTAWQDQSCSYKLHCIPQDIDFSHNMILGVSIHSDCMALHSFSLAKDPSQNAYIVIVSGKAGHCNTLKLFQYWVTVPRPPAGYRVLVSKGM